IGLSPLEHARLGRPERLVEFQELSYHNAVVPIFDADPSARALRAAAKLVGHDAKVDAVHVIEVPPHLPLDAALPDDDLRGASLRRVRATMETVDLRVRDGAATILLNRPDVLNAWNRQFGEDLLSAVEQAASDDAVRAVVIRGAGRGFSSGADLRDMSGDMT